MAWNSHSFIQLFVRSGNRNTFSLNVKSSDTIETVKHEIQKKLSIPVSEQDLTFGSRSLKDNCTLSDYDMDVSTHYNVDLYQRIRSQVEGMKIFVKTIAGEIISLEVSPSHTVENIKVKIKDKIGIQLDQQILMFGEKKMKDDHTLAYYKIHTEHILHLVANPQATVEVRSAEKSSTPKNTKGKNYVNNI